MQSLEIKLTPQPSLPDAQPAYIGRFAPSPTGPLHLGSLFTALASYLHARHHQGKWLLRIDDLDRPRNKAGSFDAILTTLEAFGLAWDDSIYFQSQHIDVYDGFLEKLAQNQLTYHCICSRKFLEAPVSGNRLDNKPIYPGTCRGQSIDNLIPNAIRIKTDNDTITFHDGLQGAISRNLATQDGDFILKRKDGIVAYQFAVVVDDYLQGINHVVRGFDLLEETPKQIYLHQLLGFSTPAYMHVPIIIDQQGYKLSKQTLATAVDFNSPHLTLFYLLVLLKQNPPNELKGYSVPEILDWAITHWQSDALYLGAQICS